MERAAVDDGADPETARLATVLRQPVAEIEKRKQIPLLAFDFVFRAQASLVVLWALGDDSVRRVIERAHERAVATVLRWLEDEVAEVRWSSGRKRAKSPALVVARFRHFDNRDGFPLLHDHCLILNRAQRPDGSWYALDTVRLLQHVVAAGTLYTLTMTTEVCEELGLATVPREVTPGLRPVMEVAGVDQELIGWSSTRRQRIEDALEGITDQYVRDHGRLPGERARHGLGWWAAQDTRPAKKTPRPLEQLRAWWRASVILRFGKQMVDGLLQRCQAAGKLIRARVGPLVDTELAAVDVAAVVYTVRGTFARRHVLAEARRHLMETLRGRALESGLDDLIADEALSRARQLTVPQKGRRTPWPVRWWIVGADGKPPRASTCYERARGAGLALQNAIRTARGAPAARDGAPAATASAAARTGDHHHDQTSDAPHAVDHPGRDAARTPGRLAAAVHAHQQAAMPQEGRTTDPATWLRTPENLNRLAALTKGGRRPPPRRRRPAAARAVGHGRPRSRRPAAAPHVPARPGQGSGPRPLRGCQPASAWPISAFARAFRRSGLRIGALVPGTGGTLTDLHEPLEPLDSYPDELPAPRQRGDVNLVGLLSVADDLARSLSALKIRVQPHDPKASLVSPEKARENTEKEVGRLLGTAVYLQRHAHAAMLGRCVLGADSKEDCSTEGANLQLNVWDNTTRRDIVEDGTTGCVTHTVEAARRTMADPTSRKILLAFAADGEGTAVSRALGLGPDDTDQFLHRGLTLRPEHRAV